MSVELLEWRVLAAYLLYPNDLHFTAPSDFESPLLRRAFEVARNAHPLPVFEAACEKVGWDTGDGAGGTLLDALGGHVQLLGLIEAAKQEDAPYLGKVLKEQAAERDLTLVLAKHQQSKSQPVGERVSALLADLKAIDSMAFDPVRGHLDSAAVHVLERTQADIANPKGFHGIPIQVPGLDRHIRGLQFGNVFCVLGAANEGKSSLLTHIAVLNARTKLPYLGNQPGRCVYYSLEMTREEFVFKMAQYLSGVNYHEAVHQHADPERRQAFLNAVEQCQRQRDVKVIQGGEIRDRDDLIADIRCQARYEGVKLFYVDYIGLVKPPRNGRREKTYEEMGETIDALKEVAVDSQCVVFVAGQNDIREPSRWRHGRPTNADVADCQKIVRTADIIVHVWQPGMHLRGPAREAWDGLMVLLGGKGRLVRMPEETYVHFDGKTGQITEPAAKTLDWCRGDGQQYLQPTGQRPQR